MVLQLVAQHCFVASFRRCFPFFTLRDQLVAQQNICCGLKNVVREVKFDVYDKRQTAKIKLLPSVFSSLYIRIKIFVFSVNSKRHFSIFV